MAQAARLGDRQQRSRPLLAAVLDADALVIGAQFGNVAVEEYY